MSHVRRSRRRGVWRSSGGGAEEGQQDGDPSDAFVDLEGIGGLPVQLESRI